MEDRERYHRLAEVERQAAQRTSEFALIRQHVDCAREFEWLAVTQPYPAGVAEQNAGPRPLAS